MTSSEQSITTYINCGHYKRETTKLNDQSNIDQIHQQVRCLCGSYIPNSYCLLFYNGDTSQFVKLNQNHLDGQLNPFRLCLSIDNPVHFVELYVTDTGDENDTQSGIRCNEISHVASSDVIKETESEQDAPISNGVTDINDGHNEDLLNALINKDDDDINIFMQSVFTNVNESSLAAYPNENHPNSLISSNDTLLDNVDFDFTDFSDVLLIERQPIQNSVVNNDSSEQITTGDAMPPQNNSSNSNSIHCQPSIELSETQNIESNRLYFSLDVKPEQKDIYKSDQFNQKEETKSNGYVARIQGIKTPAQKRSSVWPKVRIPKSFRNKPNVRLVVFAVSEKLENGIRIWFEHRDKGFLPKDFTRNSRSINPIEFDVNKNTLTTEGDLILDLQMTTLWDKLKEPNKIYQLDEQLTIELHPEKHDPSSPRLFCILRDDHRYYMDTICLSDFIRSKNSSKRSLTMTTNTSQTNATVCKRARVKQN